MKRYTKSEIERLLKAIDANLESKAEIVIIGGAAALLAYNATQVTADIDSFNKVSPLKGAYEKAKDETGLEIPLSQAGVADAPYNFEDRLIAYKRLRLKKMTVLIPEVHDLILMKTIRGYEHDLEVIEEICKKNKISEKVLIERYEKEMDHVIGNRHTLDLNFAAVLSRCFGDTAGKKWFESR